MKIKLTKASDGDFEREVDISTLSDLINLIKEYPCGNALLLTREVADYTPGPRGFEPIYKDAKEIEVIIYDDYIE